MKLIVGLGNPGREYEATRHNVGWWLIDHLAGDGITALAGALETPNAATGTVAGEKVRLLKPLTFMNNSGAALKSFVRRPLWNAATDLLVVVDDVALEVGRFRLRARGSAGGHNGLKSVEQAIENQDYARLRIGVGPSEERRGLYSDLADFVLSPFARDERENVIALMPQLVEAAECWVTSGIQKAMNLYNRPSERPEE